MQPLPQSMEPDSIRLVVGVDFTDASSYALRVAGNLVRPAGALAELHVVHVAHLPYWPAVYGDVAAFVPSYDLDATRRQLIDACFSSGRDLRASISPHVRVGDPTVEIADLAREVHADLIVIGAHKRKGLARALHRSTYARIVRQAPCSVLTALSREETPEGPLVDPPCPECLAVRRDSAGATQWCKSHSEHHIHGHMYRSARDPYSGSAWNFRA